MNVGGAGARWVKYEGRRGHGVGGVWADIWVVVSLTVQRVVVVAISLLKGLTKGLQTGGNLLDGLQLTSPTHRVVLRLQQLLLVSMMMMTMPMMSTSQTTVVEVTGQLP